MLDVSDRYSPAFVAEAFRSPDHTWHAKAAQIVKAYSKRWRRSTKRSPPTFFVMLPPGHGGIEAVCIGWIFERGCFVHEVATEGLGKNKRADARESAWMLYEETWQSAHDALVAAGAILS